MVKDIHYQEYHVDLNSMNQKVIGGRPKTDFVQKNQAVDVGKFLQQKRRLQSKQAQRREDVKLRKKANEEAEL